MKAYKMTRCTTCGKKRKTYNFRRSLYDRGIFICKFCDNYDFAKDYKKNGLKFESKIRKCLKCDSNFRSIKNRRICWGCSELNKAVYSINQNIY